MASEEHPFDLGDSCECITCHKRYCTCPNRNPDGSIREMPKPPGQGVLSFGGAASGLRRDTDDEPHRTYSGQGRERIRLVPVSMPRMQGRGVDSRRRATEGTPG